jgi:hypothetical protein
MSKELSYYQSRKEYFKAKRRARYQANKEVEKAKQKIYRETHKEELKIKQKIYRETHKEELKIYYSNYDSSHKIHRIIRNARIHSYKRGLGYSPLNSAFLGSHTHHLHEESNTSFCVYIPSFLHELIPHVSKTGTGMQSINAVALSYWLIDYQFFKDD